MPGFRGSDLSKSKIMTFVYLIAVCTIGFIPLLFISGDAGGFVSVAIVLLSIFLVGWLQGTPPGERIGLKKPGSWFRTIALGFLYALIIFLVFRVLIEPLLENITGSERDLSRFDYLKGNISETLTTIGILWITAAFFEEVFFRGFLINYISRLFNTKRVGDIIAVIVSSAFFALAHGYQGISGVILTGLAGLFFAYIFLRHRDNLWVVIFAHGFTDTSGALLVYFDWYEKVTSFLF